ncbi:hypothetical protein DOY81_009984 [Sarcophaga bullata]|nr:hypothetical protein DOY81_009984 [Sarcophaga bullata]
MLQSQKKAVSLPSDDSGDGEIQVPSLDNDETEMGAGPQANQNGLYVVYPLKGGKTSKTWRIWKVKTHYQLWLMWNHLQAVIIKILPFLLLEINSRSQC